MGVIRTLQRSTLVHLWLWSIFVISALIVDLVQCCLLPIWPISKRWYRSLNGELLKLFWLQYVWLSDYWCGAELHIHCKDEDLPFVGNEHNLLVLNHRSDVDWIIIWQLASRFNLIPGGKALMKDELKYVPLIGWSFYFSEQIFLKRNYASDKENLMNQLKNVATYHFPTTTIIFCEGTRYTKEKYEKSQAFAKEKGIPGLRHHLLPRTKGFAMCVQAYKGKGVQIYDATIAYKGGKVPSLYDLMNGTKYECHLYARRIAIDDVPAETEEDISQFCHDMYRLKDDAYDYFLHHDTYAGFDKTRTLHTPPKPRSPLYIMLAWIAIVGFPILYYCYWSLTSWSMMNVLPAGVVLYGVIRVTQSVFSATTSTKSSSYGLDDKKT